MDYLEKIASHVEEGRNSDIGNCVDLALREGIPVRDVVEKGIVAGIERLGEKWKEGKAYLPEVLIAVRAAQAGFKFLEPALAKSTPVTKAKVIIGTIEGDMHSIGKDLVKLVLQASGFTVIDLGVDVTPGRFQQVVADEKPDILGISALLTTTMTSIPRVVEALTESGLRPGVKVILGGAPLDEEFARKAGADAYAKDCFQAAELATTFVQLSR
nr:cobalamin-binding protein [Desulfobacterales bacterium]